MTAAGPKWIGTSWKMNLTLEEAVAYAEELKSAAPSLEARIQGFVVPPFTAVCAVKQILADTAFKVGAQNMHWADDGAWTGEISARMLTGCGLDMVEIGHSERREHFGETDETVGRKVEAAVRYGLSPLVCIGETLREREAGEATAVLERQIRGALDRLTESQKAAPLLFAYEPVWAIGDKGVAAEPGYADARQAEVVAIADGLLGRRIPCLYGGSVNLQNCAELIALPNVDGLFVGRSAWSAKGYLDLLAHCADALDGDGK